MFYSPFMIIANKTKRLSFKSGCVIWNENSDMHRGQLQPKKTAELAIYIEAKDVLPTLQCNQDKAL